MSILTTFLMWWALINVWVVIGVTILYIAGHQSKNILETLGSALFWFVIIFIDMLEHFDKKFGD